MGRWYGLAILLWLAIAGVVAGMTAIELYEKDATESSYVEDEPEATIDGAPAFVMHSYEWASIKRDDRRAWVSRSLLMIPANGMTVAPQKQADYWRATEIPEPFHLSFIKPDGSTTGPHKIEFHEPSLLGMRAGWGPRGLRFSLVRGARNYPQDSSLLDGRVWNRDVIMQVALERFVWVGLAGVGLVLVATVLMVRDVLRVRRHLPPRPPPVQPS